MGIKAFFKKAFLDMKESAKAQHEVDKAEFAAVKKDETQCRVAENATDVTIGPCVQRPPSKCES